MKKRKILAIVLSIVFAFSLFGAMGVSAEERLQYISCAGAEAYKVASNKISIDVELDGYQNYTTDMSITINLQYYNTVTNKWVTIDTVSKDFLNSCYGELEQTWIVSTGFTYRGRVYCDGYRFGVMESLTIDTNSIAY